MQKDSVTARESLGMKNKISEIFSTVETFINKGNVRSVKAKKNILASFALKGASIIITFLLIPLTINYVNPTEYGIWITLSSIIGWVSFFDIGLGNGLKNKLAEANALGEKEKARVFVSTTYAALILISLFLFILFFYINGFINWSQVLNATTSDNKILNNVVLTVFACFCIQFVVQLIYTVLTGLHSPAKVSFIYVVGQIFCLITILILTKTTTGSLTKLVLVLAGVPLVIQIIASFWLFNTSYKSFSPSIKFVNFKYAKELLNIGGFFFIIQIGALVLYETDNIIITQLFGPEEVTTFNIAYKLFNVLTMLFMIIMSPFWSAFTDAYAKNDLDWIKRVLSKMRKYWLLLIMCSAILLAVSGVAYQLWLNGQVQVPFSLSFVMSLYVVALTWQTIHVFLLNGIGKIKLQLYLVVVSAVINIPLAVVLGKWLGLAGVTLANTLIFFILGGIYYVQCEKILNGKAVKIWNQ